MPATPSAPDEDAVGGTQGALESGQTGRWVPLRNRDYRFFFAGDLVNEAGSSMAWLSMAFAVLGLTGSAADVGIVAAASTLPMVLFMLVGGSIADRFPRAVVLRGTNLIQASAQGACAALVLTGTGQVWQLAALQFVSGLAGAVAYPAFHGMVPILLPPPERKHGYLLIGQAQSLVGILGPAVAGLFVATVGAGWGLAIDAATFLVSAVLLSFVRLPLGERPDQRPSVLGDLRAGWSYARAVGWVIPVALTSLVFNSLMSGAVRVLGPVIADTTIGAQGWGLARSGQAIGSLVAAAALASVAIRRPLLACLAGFSLSALPMLVLGLRPDTWMLLGAFLATGVGLAVINLAWNLVVAEKIEEGMISRIMAIDGFFSFLAIPLGQVAAGPAAAAFGVHDVQVGAAGLVVATALFGACLPVLRRVRLDEPSARS